MTDIPAADDEGEAFADPTEAARQDRMQRVALKARGGEVELLNLPATRAPRRRQTSAETDLHGFNP